MRGTLQHRPRGVLGAGARGRPAARYGRSKYAGLRRGSPEKACTWKTRPRTDYHKYFGLTAHVWKKSTELSIENLFNDASAMKQSPPSGPGWSASVLAPRFHFINCHGEERTPKYLWAEGQQFPHLALFSETEVQD